MSIKALKNRQLNIFSCLIVIALLLFLPVTAWAGGNERIINFHSEITLLKDASMLVRETIEVVSEGLDIRRGIYRDFPTRYKDRFGNNIVVDFEVVEILRNGNPENYHIKRMANGKRIYIGDSNIFLAPGYYTYTIAYRTNRQLGFFKEHDELYWNVTGNGWMFPIEKVTVTVNLPEGVPPQ